MVRIMYALEIGVGFCATFEDSHTTNIVGNVSRMLIHACDYPSLLHYLYRSCVMCV